MLEKRITLIEKKKKSEQMIVTVNTSIQVNLFK